MFYSLKMHLWQWIFRKAWRCAQSKKLTRRPISKDLETQDRAGSALSCMLTLSPSGTAQSLESKELDNMLLLSLITSVSRTISPIFSSCSDFPDGFSSLCPISSAAAAIDQRQSGGSATIDSLDTRHVPQATPAPSRGCTPMSVQLLDTAVLPQKSHRDRVCLPFHTSLGANGRSQSNAQSLEMVQRLLALNDLGALHLKRRAHRVQFEGPVVTSENLLCGLFAIMTNMKGTEPLFKE